MMIKGWLFKLLFYFYKEGVQPEIKKIERSGVLNRSGLTVNNKSPWRLQDARDLSFKFFP
jgi:hypothetical protein